ncbi:MAG: YggT family protein [Anaerolineaceae bacterium]|nr:YggT family protein [Anaerolineaceae bacterium]
MTSYKEVTTSQHEQGQNGRVATFKATQLIWLFLGILEALLALRFIFKLVGVNEANTFASFLYGLTGIFLAPFSSLTGAPSTAGMTFEFSTLIAMFVYAMIGWALERLVYVLFYRPRGPVSTQQRTVVDQTPSNVSSTTTTEHTDSQTSNRV